MQMAQMILVEIMNLLVHISHSLLVLIVHSLINFHLALLVTRIIEKAYLSQGTYPKFDTLPIYAIFTMISLTTVSNCLGYCFTSDSDECCGCCGCCRCCGCCVPKVKMTCSIVMNSISIICISITALGFSGDIGLSLLLQCGSAWPQLVHLIRIGGCCVQADSRSQTRSRDNDLIVPPTSSLHTRQLSAKHRNRSGGNQADCRSRTRSRDNDLFRSPISNSNTGQPLDIIMEEPINADAASTTNDKTTQL
ncbi:MAG: hypothetical protein MHMPM18_003528 [Marteilia pararefringens]